MTVIMHTILLTTALLAIGATAEAAEKSVTLKVSFADQFLVGTAVNRNMVTGGAGFRRSAEQSAKDVALIKEQFNQIAPENDLKWQIIALHARADILSGAAHRFIAINPRHPYAQALAEPWLAKADRAHHRLIAIARTAPREVLAHPVVRYAIIDAGRTHQQVARR